MAGRVRRGWDLRSNALRPAGWTSADAAGLPILPGLLRYDEVKAGFDSSALRADTRTVLRAMQTYGLILADNGSPWYFQGTAENRWPTGLLDELKSIPASAFEAVDASSLRVSANSGRAR